MRILVINPNTSAQMTGHLQATLDGIKGPQTTVVAVNPSAGPAAIESAADEADAIPRMLALVQEAEPQGYDAIVIACFADPGLDACREVAHVPVVGLEEAALHTAAMLGHRFTILTTRARRVPAKIEHVARLGLSERLASIRPLEMGVLEMEAQPVLACERALDVGRRAVEEDGAEVLVLGCAGLAGHGTVLQDMLGVAVVDPAPVALKTAEMLVDLRLTHSKRGLYATPPHRQVSLSRIP